MNLNIGCNANILSGWRNVDLPEVDIKKPLPFLNDSVENILVEHVIENISCQEALRFLDECHRILEQDGAIRICVPAIDKLFSVPDEYCRYISDNFTECKSNKDAVRIGILHHGYQSWWTTEILIILLMVCGFNKIELCSTEESERKVFKNVDGHARHMHKHHSISHDEALKLNDSQTVIMEAEK